jgi:hypothetical protein
MISGWIAERGLHCTLNIGMWDASGRNEPKAWGVLLADVVRHIANAIEEQKGADAGETAQTIMDAMEREFESPTRLLPAAFILATREQPNPSFQRTASPPLN